jgi:hypothetical protein
MRGRWSLAVLASCLPAAAFGGQKIKWQSPEHRAEHQFVGGLRMQEATPSRQPVRPGRSRRRAKQAFAAQELHPEQAAQARKLLRRFMEGTDPTKRTEVRYGADAHRLLRNEFIQLVAPGRNGPLDTERNAGGSFELTLGFDSVHFRSQEFQNGKLHTYRASYSAVPIDPTDRTRNFTLISEKFSGLPALDRLVLGPGRHLYLPPGVHDELMLNRLDPQQFLADLVRLLPPG